ncbi:unnamed protein product, partial [Rotaria magnacalcarata]
MPSPYMVNNLLVSQLKEFLLEDAKRIRWSLERIAQALKDRYREYQRQKVRPFTRSVEKAYEILLADNEFLSFVSAKNENLKDDEISSDSEDEWDQQAAHRPNTMNQMVSNLYASNVGASSQGNSNVQMETSTKPEEEQQAKRKQTTEKSVKKVKRKKP